MHIIKKAVDNLDHIHNLAIQEISEFYIADRPLYQSMQEIHIKHKNNKIFSNAILKTTALVIETFGANLVISNSWFNLVNRRSDSTGLDGFHMHADTVIATAVLYISNCTSSGTIIYNDNNPYQLLVEDGDILIFDPKLLHAVPDPTDKDRITVAVEYVAINN